MTKGERKELIWKALLSAFSIALVSIVGLLTYLVKEVHNLDTSNSIIRNSRCTDIECGDMRRDIAILFNKVERIPLEIPSAATRAKLESYGERLSVIESKIRKD